MSKFLAKVSRLFAAALAIGATLMGLAVYSVPFARFLDEMARNVEQAERFGRFSSGVPLRGTPDLDRLDGRLANKGLKLGDPVYLRIFKREAKLELWMKPAQGERFVLFATYPVCYWSGRLGPKLAEGDRQSPEGFYTVDKTQLNPDSRWHRSFNLGFPNAFDREHGRTGSYLMVHGGCSSIGCYAMTNPVIDEIWRLVTAALDKGQRRFAVHVFPFRMTERLLALYGDMGADALWRDMKPAYDLFEELQVPPKVSVCRGRYAMEPGDPGADGSAALAEVCPGATASR